MSPIFKSNNLDVSPKFGDFPSLTLEKKESKKQEVYPKYLKNNRQTLDKFLTEKKVGSRASSIASVAKK
jgi:hypothetical protein